MTIAGASGLCSEKRDDHLGRLMIICVGKVKTSLARQACVLKIEMIIWVAEDAEMIIWVSSGNLMGTHNA